MKQICSPKHCTGCGSCVNACPKQCISLDYDKNGFLHPYINKHQCIDCGRCEKVCPSRNTVKRDMPIQAIVACSRNEDIVRESSSGGIFSELARSIFDVGGIVCGAVFAEDFLTVQHSVATNLDELSKMRGSKYIQSNARSIYKETKVHLQDGKTVLFSGTPCQVAGLKTYLGKEYPNLITVDFVCHGVASTKAYQEYLKSLDIQEKICDFSFRYKKTSDDQYANCMFRICLANGTCVEENWLASSLGYAFANNLLSRYSCSLCSYATVSRVSDITVADYISNIDDESLRKSRSAKSLILINTKTGAEAFNRIKKDLLYSEISIEKAVCVSKHLSSPAIQHRNRRMVFKHLGKCSWNELSAKYFTVYKPIRTFESIKNKFKIQNER